MEELVKYLKALLIFQLQGKDPEAVTKPEVLLAKCGFAHKEIAELLGKNQAAVSKVISRAQKA